MNLLPSPPCISYLGANYCGVKSGRGPRGLGKACPLTPLTRYPTEPNSAGEEEEDVKVPLPSRQLSGVFAFEPLATSGSMVEKLEPLGSFGNGMEAIGVGRIVGLRGKRGPAALETLDRSAQQRLKRMIKNRESAARSRERKQAYHVELESLVAKLEEENDQLLKEKVERTEGRLKQIMEKVIPVVEKPKTVRPLRKIHSM